MLTVRVTDTVPLSVGLMVVEAVGVLLAVRGMRAGKADVPWKLRDANT